jgi:hypothetical protein
VTLVAESARCAPVRSHAATRGGPKRLFRTQRRHGQPGFDGNPLIAKAFNEKIGLWLSRHQKGERRDISNQGLGKELRRYRSTEIQERLDCFR